MQSANSVNSLNTNIAGDAKFGMCALLIQVGDGSNHKTCHLPLLGPCALILLLLVIMFDHGNMGIAQN